MRYQITKVRLSANGTRHEHITDLWAGQSFTRADVVDRIEKGTDSFFVADTIAPSRTVDVHVVNASPKYVQTKRDGVLTDNLLQLPRF